ncbi:predicted protein [Histoplasma capsulatum H143]|uniref:Uncharacterized protein n=1 Tax=Ajellomyces capsulatus (strain H143) TaxID=544712 RepID=C6HIZ3_AJECH|nr:predicted protein [Histoplasma capsulatum H143]
MYSLHSTPVHYDDIAEIPEVSLLPPRKVSWRRDSTVIFATGAAACLLPFPILPGSFINYLMIDKVVPAFWVGIIGLYIRIDDLHIFHLCYDTRDAALEKSPSLSRLEHTTGARCRQSLQNEGSCWSYRFAPYFTLLPKNKGRIHLPARKMQQDPTCRLLAHPSISHTRCRLAVPALTSSPFVPHRFSMVASDWEPPSRFWPARPGETWPPTQLQDDWSPVAAHAASRQLHSKCGVWLSGFSWKVGAWDR